MMILLQIYVNFFFLIFYLTVRNKWPLCEGFMVIKKKKSNGSYGEIPIKGEVISLRGLLPKVGIKYKREVYKGKGDTFKSVRGECIFQRLFHDKFTVC